MLLVDTQKQSKTSRPREFAGIEQRLGALLGAFLELSLIWTFCVTSAL